jgi:hypothetical protein
MRLRRPKRSGAIGMGMGLGMGFRGGKPAPLTPDQLLTNIAGKVIWLRAKLGSSYGNGNPAATLFDASGNGNNTTTLSNGSTNPTYTSAQAQLNSKDAYRFAGFGFNAPSVFPTSGAKFAIAVVSVDSAAAGNQTWSTSGGTHGLKIQTATDIRVRKDGNAYDYTCAALPSGAPICVAYAYDPSTGYINAWVQGQWIGQTGSIVDAGDASDIQVCDFEGAGQFTGYFGDGFVANVYPSPQALWNAFQAYNSIYAYSAAGNPILIFGGASLNTDVDSGTNFEQNVLAGLTGTITSYDVWASGASIETTITNLATNELAKIAVRQPCVVGGILGARASMDPGGQGDTAAQAYASLQTYCGRVRAAGAKVVVYSAPMANSAGAADMSTVLTAYNALVKAGWSGFADGFVDFASNPNLGTPGCQSNLTYYQADRIHPTHATCVIEANLAIPVLQGLL